MKLIKEETILRKFEGIKTIADNDTSLSRTDRECLKGMIDSFCDIVKRLPDAEDEDPDVQVCYWHDLRKDPTDLPDDGVLCWGHVAGTDVEREVHHEDRVWLNSADGRRVNVIAWTDMPVFLMEDEEDDAPEAGPEGPLDLGKRLTEAMNRWCQEAHEAIERLGLGKVDKC